MRRKDRETSQENAYAILDRCEYATLSMINEDNTPYGVAISPVRENEHLYFHCAKTGQKNDNLKRNPRVHLFAVGRAENYPEKFAVKYESVMVNGKAEEVMEDEEKLHALRLICEKYAPNHLDGFDNEIKAAFKATAIFKITIENISGKASDYDENGKPIKAK